MNATMHLDRQPAILPLYINCLTKPTKNRLDLAAISQMKLEFQHCSIKPKQLKKFNRFYNLNHTQHVPLTFLYLLVFRPQLKFLLNPKLPFSVLGLVHVFNHIQSFKPVYLEDNLTIDIQTKEFKETAKGKELVLTTRILRNDECVWQCFSGYLSPHKTRNVKRPNTPYEKPHYFHSMDWHIPANTGRQFALLSGDANPIHTYKLAAKLFGFKQAIAHGMCSAIKCWASLPHSTSAMKKELYTEFKKPIFLPSTVRFEYEKQLNGKYAFQVENPQNKTALQGYYQETP